MVRWPVMNRWMLFILVMVAWLLWAAGGLVSLWVGKRQWRLPADRGFSFLPIFPIVPILFFGTAMLLDAAFAPWGTRIIGTLHIILIALVMISVIRDIFLG